MRFPEGRRAWLIPVVLYPLVTLATRHWFLQVPFDSETVTRFVHEFMFNGRATLGWTLGESLRWDLTRPLYSLTFLADFLLHGSDFRLWHLTDFILAWVSVAVVSRLVFGLLDSRAAWTSMLVWLLMPAHVWSLSSFTGRNDRLAGLFILLAVAAADSWRTRPGQARRLAVPFMLLLAFLSKESAVFMLPLPFAWLWMAGGWSLGRLSGERAAWIPALLLPFACFGIRALLGMPLGDTGTLNTGRAWLHQFGGMLLMGIPGVTIMARELAGAVGVPLLTCAVLIRRLHPAVRLGALLILLSVSPFAFVWIQHSFQWMPAAGMALVLGGIMSSLARRGGAASTAVTVALLAIYAVWGTIEARNLCTFQTAFHEVAVSTASAGPGPVFQADLSGLRNRQLLDQLGYGSPGIEERAVVKARSYVEDLLQVETGRPGDSIAWPERISR